MAANDATQRSENARRAAQARWSPEARRDLHATRLEEHVKRVVAQAPPLTPEQVARVVDPLRPFMGGTAA